MISIGRPALTGHTMPNLTARLDRIEGLLAPRHEAAIPVFIEPRDCLDREAFAQACRVAAGAAPCIVILPENGREAGAVTAAHKLHMQPGRN